MADPFEQDPFDIASRLVDELVALDPILATSLGIPGYDHLWPDLSPEGHDSRHDLFHRYRWAFAAHLEHPDPHRRLASQIMTDWLEERLAEYRHGEHLRDLAHIASPFQEIREIFDQMRRETDEDWDAIRARLQSLDRVLAGYGASLRLGAQLGLVASRRQVESVIRQARHLAGPHSAFLALLDAQPDLEAAVESAKGSAGGFAEWLEREYLPYASPEDGAGPDRYRLAVDRQIGLEIDPEETYRWGWEEVVRLWSEMEKVADEILPGGTVPEVVDLLENDPARAARSVEEFVEFIEARLAQAVEELDGTHFDVPEPIRRVTVNIAPPGGALGAYYLAPSEDFTRPGSVWYSVGDRTVFPLYQEVTTAYHEGFPGHHLQVGTAMAMKERLSRAHRLLVWYPGYGEGWALYAERLMDELGFFDRPEYRFGFLASQIFRATRVVVDTGLHLGFEIPERAPLHAGERWNFEIGVAYIRGFGMQPLDYAESEVTRYLGWPGQAISYKVGERELLSLRDRVRVDLGSAFDPRGFHRLVLVNGEMRLDRLRRLVLSNRSSGGSGKG